MSEPLPRVSLSRLSQFVRHLAIFTVVIGVLCCGLAGFLAWSAFSLVHSPSIEALNALDLTPAYVEPSRVAVLGASTRASMATPSSLLAARQKALNEVIAQHPELTLAVAMVPLQPGDPVMFHENDDVVAASTTKLLTAVYVLSLADKRSILLTQTVGGITIQQLVTQMVQQSDNSAWQALSNRFGWNAQQAYTQSLGMDSYNWSTNQISAKDLALLLQKLYNRQLLSEKSTTFLLSLMEHTNQEQLLPAALPQATHVYHKYGWIDGLIHDAGIVVMGEKRYVLVILTDGSTSFAARAVVFKEVVASLLL
jgi:beta-lactamase class A